MDDAALSPTPGPVAPARPRWQLIAVTVPIAAVLVAGYFAGAGWPKMFNTHPLLLIALSPINRFLLLTTNHLDWYSYYGVGLARHLFPDPFFYLIGSWYGVRAIRWIGESSPAITKLTGEDGTGLSDPAHRKLIYPLAFFVPNNWVSLLSGASDIPWRTFAALNISGTLLRLLLCRWIGSLFQSQIEAIATWVGRYSTQITVASVIVVLVGIGIQFRRGTGQLVGLTHLDELDSDD